MQAGKEGEGSKESIKKAKKLEETRKKSRIEAHSETVEKPNANGENEKGPERDREETRTER